MKNRFYIFILGLFVWSMFSCNNDETCRLNHIVNAGIYFYKDTLNTKNKWVSFSYSIDSITVYGEGMDSILYNNSKTKSYIQLPFNQNVEESKFILTANNTIDTLTVKYTNINHFLSFECGYTVFHNIDTAYITGHYFQELSIPHKEVNVSTTASNEKNIILHHIIQ